jgi:hypothetical protein
VEPFKKMNQPDTNNEVVKLRKALRPFIRYAQLHGSMDLVGRNKSSLSRNDWEAAIEAYYAPAPEEADQFRDTTKMVPDLEPCPFCGATKDDSEIIEPTENCVEPSLALHTWEHGDGHATYLVQCARCECEGPPSYQSGHAIHLWNTRK